MIKTHGGERDSKEEEMPKPVKKKTMKKTRKRRPRRRSSKGGFWDEVEKFLGIKQTRKRSRR